MLCYKNKKNCVKILEIHNKKNIKDVYYLRDKYINDDSSSDDEIESDIYDFPKIIKNLKKNKMINLDEKEISKLRQYLNNNKEILNDNYNIIKKTILEYNKNNIKLIDGNIFILPYNPLYNNIQRLVYFISGKSGSGKSYKCGIMANMLYKFYKKNGIDKNIYIISNKEDDKAYSLIKNKKQLIIDDSLLENPITLNDFIDDDKDGAIIIMDDYQLNNNKKIKSQLDFLKNKILEEGRDYNNYSIDLFIINHETNDSKNTKKIWNECNIILIHHNQMTYMQLKYTFDKLGIDKDVINQIKKLKTDYIMIYPMIKLIIYEKGCFLYD